MECQNMVNLWKSTLLEAFRAGALAQYEKADHLLPKYKVGDDEAAEAFERWLTQEIQCQG